MYLNAFGLSSFLLVPSSSCSSRNLILRTLLSLLFSWILEVLFYFIFSLHFCTTVSLAFHLVSPSSFYKPSASVICHQLPHIVANMCEPTPISQLLKLLTLFLTAYSNKYVDITFHIWISQYLKICSFNYAIPDPSSGTSLLANSFEILFPHISMTSSLPFFASFQ